MKVPFLDLPAQYRSLRPEIDLAMQQVLDTSAYILGPSVEAFEKEFATYCGTDYCIGMNSGTAAIALLLQAHTIGPGDEVITVTSSFFASAEAISEVGAIPVLVDCERDTALIDVTKIEAAITSKTKAIIPVHLYGQVADMDEIVAIAKKHGLLVFEDACQAHGSMYKGRKAGSLADGAAFSFYPGKNLGAYGEAGAVTLNNPEIAKKLKMLREHGMPQRYHHDLVGWNERMDGIQGAVLGVKLNYLDTWNAKRAQHAALYRSLLPEQVTCMTERPDRTSCHHLFVIKTHERDALQEHLTAQGIQTAIHYPIPIHLQNAYADRGWKQGDFPIAEEHAKRILSLPMSAELTEEQVRYVCENIRNFFS